MMQESILIIDDNHDLADSLELLLVDEGYQVTLAYNGLDAIRLVNETASFDLIIIDVKLPDMCGLEILQHIHEKDPAASTVMMTGYRIDQVLSEVVDNGSVEVLRKPFTIDHLLEVIRQTKDESIILIETDDPGFADDLVSCLDDNQMTAMSVRNQYEVVDGVASSVDVLLLDLRKPVINAAELYLGLKQENRAVKTVIVTGHSIDVTENVDLLRSVSVTGCLFKPFKPEKVLHVIRQMIDH